MKLLLAVSAVVAVATSSELEENIRTFTKSAANFDIKFLTELSWAKPQQSVVTSPFFVISLLLELSMGAEGESHDQIQRVVGVPGDDFVRSIFPSVIDKLTTIKNATLNVAFANFITQGYKIRKEFDNIAKLNFRSALSPVDFSKSVDAANTINSWVDNKTSHKIKNLVSAKSLSSDTRLAMCNAIYFKGEWEIKFNKNLTRDLDFHTSSKKMVSIPTMYTEAEFKYAKSNKLKAQILELPYRGGDVSMVIVLPDEIDGLKDLITALKKANVLADEMQNMGMESVHTQIPKLKIETEIDLKEILIKLGIDKIFDESTANLSRLLETNEILYVSHAKQKATFEVDEEGAKASAANVVIVESKSAALSEESIEFRADHPFLFYLKKENMVLFSGIFAN